MQDKLFVSLYFSKKTAAGTLGSTKLSFLPKYVSPQKETVYQGAVTVYQGAVTIGATSKSPLRHSPQFLAAMFTTDCHMP
jgi:hypothetical protein